MIALSIDTDELRAAVKKLESAITRVDDADSVEVLKRALSDILEVAMTDLPDWVEYAREEVRDTLRALNG